MRMLIVAALALSLCACAIPVRPIAYMEKDPVTGNMHFTPDKDQEPSATGMLATVVDFAGTFWPQGAAIAGTVLAFLQTRKATAAGKAVRAAVAFGVDMTKAETDADAEMVKDMHSTIQEQTGVKGLIDAALKIVKA